VYLGTRGKLKLVTYGKPSFSDAKSPEIAAEEWDRNNFMVMLGFGIAWNRMFLPTSYFILLF